MAMSEADTIERIARSDDEAAILGEGTVQRRGPVGMDWATIARNAERDLAGVAAPDRPAAIEKLAGEDLSSKYLKRALAVLPLIDDPYFKKVRLSALALQGVEAIRRWSTYDRPAALLAAQALEARRVSVPDLIKKEKRARELNGSAPIQSVDRSRDLRKSAFDWAKSEHPATARLVTSNSKLDSIFYVEETRDGKPYRTAYISAGPFSSITAERHKLRGIVLQALGLLMLDNEVKLICSSDGGKTFVDEFLDERGFHHEKLTVLSAEKTFLKSAASHRSKAA